MFNSLFRHISRLKHHALLVLMLAFLAALLGAVRPAAAQTQPWMNTALTPLQRANLLLAAMTQDEKNILMHGGAPSAYVGNTDAIPRLGIPALYLHDGPAGVANGNGGVTAFPAPITLAMAWDTNLAQQYGTAMGQEFLGKGANVALGPMMNLDRIPVGGRNWEGYGEDPYLSARMAYYEIIGIQSQGVIATAKHYLNNEQENNRSGVSSDVDERTQHEIYLPPFKASVQAGVGAMMCAYNLINSVYSCENAVAQNQYLKNEMGFQGWMMSDWFATHSAVASANNGLDMEMPGNGWFGSALTSAVASGQVSQSQYDNIARRVLTSMFQMGLFDHAPSGNINADVRTTAHTQVARTVAAEGLVLLKNANAVLPLTTAIHSIAVIGSAASTNVIAVGGGSGWVSPPYVISPLQGITSRAGSGVSVTYTQGDVATGAVVSSQYLKTPGGATGLQGEYFTNTTLTDSATLTRTDANVDFNWNSGAPGAGIAAANWSARWTGTLTPPSTGSYVLMLTSDDGSRMYVNNTLVVDNWGDHQDQTASGSINLTAGQAYTIRIEYYNGGGGDDVHFAWLTPTDNVFAAAANAAHAADVAIVVVGTTSGEGSDRASLSLPGTQDALISAVTAANTRTIVVAYAPAQILMPWSGQAAAILFSGMPGQETGNALADVLFGDVNPSGKLPFTIAQATTDYPVNTTAQYPGVNNHAAYSEGMLIGYRHFDAHAVTPLFPFGHGLSYTTFNYANLSVTTTGGATPTGVTVAFDVTNAGSRAGSEVTQLYLGYPSSAGEPPKGLKTFQRVTLAAGQTQRVSMTLAPADWSYWETASHGWAVAGGTYSVMVGSSSRDIRLTGSFTSTGVTPPTPMPTATPMSGSNLALNRPVTCSSDENAGTPCASAVDGNTTTRWASAFSDPQSITVDLGSTKTLATIVLNWEAAYATAFQIQTSNDAATWTTIYSTTTGTDGVQSLSVSGSGRYVRMNGTTRATTFGYSLWEFEVYGTSGATNTPTRTPTPIVGASNTPVAVTNTPTRTNTPPGPTLTPTRTNTLAGPTATPAGCGSTNAALNKPATASSVLGGNTAPMAVDGNTTSTRWESIQGVDPQWMQIDLGSTQSICHVKLIWETAYGSSYQIQTSPDAVTWTSIYTTNTGDGGIDDLTSLSGSGRYVRMYGTVRATGYGYSLWEFEVYTGGGVTVTPTPTPTRTLTPIVTPTLSANLALNRPVTSSSNENASLTPNLAVDGNTTTRWSSAFSDPQWLQIDLGTTRTINRVVLRWEAAFGKAYQIQTSPDGTTWTSIYSTTAGDGGVDDLTVSGSGRYIRMVGTVRALTSGYSLFEFEVYGQ